MRYRVGKACLQKGARIEAREHPGFTKPQTTRIASQHIAKYGPGYYAAEKQVDKIIAARTKAMMRMRKR